MSSASKPKIIFQLFAIALHSFIFSAFVLAALAPIADRLSVAEPLRESRLMTLGEFTDGATFNRGVKRFDNQSPTAVLALAVFYPAQVQQFSLRNVSDSQQFDHRTVSGSLPIRSPPPALSR